MRLRPHVAIATALVAIASTLALPSAAPPAVASTAPSASPITTSSIDSADTGRWQYIGNWQHRSSPQGSQGGSEAVATEAGARATLQFSGTSVRIEGIKTPAGGQWRATLDCTTITLGSSFSPFPVANQTVVEFTGLTNTVHTVVIEALGEKSWPATSTEILIDRAIVTSEPTVNAALERYVGTGPTATGEPLELRRPGCGERSELLDAMKAAHHGERFVIPGTTSTLGSINGHALDSKDYPQAVGPLVVNGAPREGISVPLLGGQPLKFALHLTDRPRSLQVSIAADPAFGQPVQAAIVNSSGEVLPYRIIDTVGATSAHSGQFFTMHPHEEYTVIADLRDASGVGAVESVFIALVPTTDLPAQAIILGGRTSDLSVDRLVEVTMPGTSIVSDAERLAAPASAFQYGPVVLSRVLADAGRSAWTGTHATAPWEQALAVPLTFGNTVSGHPLRVDGTALGSEAFSVQLPWAASGTTSVYLKFDTQQRCRSLTASIGIDDSTENRAAASVAVGVHGDGEPMPLAHNGTWRATPVTAIVSESERRTALASETREAKLAWAKSVAPDAQNLAALTALINTEYDTLMKTVDSRSAEHMSFPVSNPVVLGAGSTVTVAPEILTRDQGLSMVHPTQLSPTALFSLSADLISSRVKAALVNAGTHTVVGAEQIESALPRIVHLVITGTPGAIVDVAGAGMDCVSAQPGADGSPAPRAMPLYSQLGIPPMFLPAPRDASGKALSMLGRNAEWWDMACPSGPSTTGMMFTATRQRITHMEPNYDGYRVVDSGYETVDVAHATKPACGFPADQLAENYGSYAFSHQIGERYEAEHKYIPHGTTYVDSVKTQIAELEAAWTLERHPEWYNKVWNWAEKLVRETGEDTLTWVLWLAILPFDLPAGIVFNPYTLHALPLPAQIAAGGLFLAPAAIEGLMVRALPAASAAGRLSESTGDALLVTEARAGAGGLAVLDVGDGAALGLPLKQSTNGLIADVRIDTATTPRVANDSVTSTLPPTTDRPVWETEPESVREERPVIRCTRGEGPADCVAHESVPGTPSDPPAEPGNPAEPGEPPVGPGNPAEPTDPPAGPPGDAPDSIDLFDGTHEPLPVDGRTWYWKDGRWNLRGPQTFAERYRDVPEMNTRRTSALSEARGSWAGAATDLLAQQSKPWFASARVLEQDSSTAKMLAPMMSADNAPLYFASAQSPHEVFHSGLIGTVGPPEEGEALIVNHNPEEWILASRDRHLYDWLQFEEFAQWSYKIVRPFGQGGGFDLESGLGPNNLWGWYVREKGAVAFPAVDGASIESATLYLMNPNTRRFEAVTTINNSLFDIERAYGPGVTQIPELADWEKFGEAGTAASTEFTFDGPIGAGAHGADEFTHRVKPVASPPPAEMVAQWTNSVNARIVFSNSVDDWLLLGERWGLTDSVLKDLEYEKLYDPNHPTVPVYVAWDRETAGLEPWPDTSHPGTRSEWPTGEFSISGGSGALTDTGITYRAIDGVHVVGAGASGGAGSRWRLEKLDDGTFRILNTAHPTALHATGNPYDLAPMSGGLNVVASPASWNSVEQRWNLLPNEDGTTTLTSVAYPGHSLEYEDVACPDCGAGFQSVVVIPSGHVDNAWHRWNLVE